MSIKKVFKQHFKLVFNDEGQRECQCGFFIGNGDNAGKRHKKHAIQVLEQHTRDKEAKAWQEGVGTALNHAILNPDGITLRLEHLDGRTWDNPYRKEARDE